MTTELTGMSTLIVGGAGAALARRIVDAACEVVVARRDVGTLGRTAAPFGSAARVDAADLANDGEAEGVAAPAEQEDHAVIVMSSGESGALLDADGGERLGTWPARRQT